MPRPRGLASACRRLDLDPAELVLGGGEDYELLFTVRPGAPSEAVLQGRLGLPVREIGRITASGLRLAGAPAGRPPGGGWRHF